MAAGEVFTRGQMTMGGRILGNRIRGRSEMRELALAAASALDDVDLSEELGALQTRVLGRPSDELFDVGQSDDGSWAWSFKPMVELLLREILDVAHKPAMPMPERRRQIEWALRMSGF